MDDLSEGYSGIKKEDKQKMKMKLSNIADRALNLKLSNFGKIMMRIISFVNKYNITSLYKKAMPKKMLM